MRRFILVLLYFFYSAPGVFAQSGQGAIRATITNAKDGMPIPFVNVAVKQNGMLITGGAGDIDGNVEIKPVSPGKYDIEITSLGHQPKRVSGVIVIASKTTFLDKENTKMSSGIVDLVEFEIAVYKEPLVKIDGSARETTVTEKDIRRMAARDPTQITAAVGGVYAKDNGSGDVYIGGSRSDASYYYIDGIKVRGSLAIPQTSIEQISVITGGLPAQYGDVTGGVINITTKGVSREYVGGFEYLTSGVKLGNSAYVGTDPYGYNLLEASLSGPLLSKRDSAGKKEPLLGFFLSGNFTHAQDPRPSAVGAWKVKDDVLEAIKEDPLRTGFAANSVIPNTDYLRLSDFERVKVRPNTPRLGANIAGKIDVVTTSNTNLTFGGTLNYGKSSVYQFGQALFDSESYPERTDLDWRVYGRFTQRFKNQTAEEAKESSSIIKNAYYTIQADYSQEYERRWDPDLKNNFFDYGYIGKFKTHQGADYQQGADSITGIFGNIQQTFRDTLITFEPGTANPELARFTQRYYELNGWKGFDEEGNAVYDPELVEAFTNINEIQSGGGLINGDNLSGSRDVYGMWSYNTDVWGNSDRYFESITNQIRVSGQGSADVGDHQFIVGFEYEQRIDKAYSLNPRRLWTIARQRANEHIQQIDYENPIITYPGPTVSYSRLNSSPGEYWAGDGTETQGFIDYNLRRTIGLNPDGVDYLDVNSLDPSVYKIEYFSADELYNGGGNSSVVSYYGYDVYGNRSNANPSFDDFFTERDKFGNFTRPIAPFQPIYVAGFIEDKFEFRDLIFRAGLRVDRYDANQQVLKDEYSLFPTIKAQDDASKALLPEGVDAHPGNIGDDYVVYVDNIDNPTAILGYRDGTTWYNAEGAELQDASALRVSNGLPAPMLQDPSQETSEDITSASFEDYKPQTNFMPRVAFSFPISDEANFFAHYDVLTKRPTYRTRLDPSAYYYLQSTPTSTVLNNPSLQPEKTVDYEVGFQQALTNSSALKISAFYKEFRDMVATSYVFDAYPKEYITVRNLDFATVKGMTISYDLRRTNNLTIRASYTLQFAEGTGSSSTSGLNLARSGQPNLRAPVRLSFDQRHQFVANIDYRYADGEDYNGPVLSGKQILKNTGANLTLRGGSGEPYNPQANFSSTAFLRNNSPSPLQKGQINSASLPWKFRFDLMVDRDVIIKGKGEGEEAKEHSFNVYVQVLNLLNARNINQVYRATGNPDDDGYLNSSLGTIFTGDQNSPSSFSEYYTMKLWDPQNWELPRRVRVGVRFNF